MPRGEETQEANQEGREESKEVQEQETQRTQEVVEQPQVVVERERPVEESEKIEREVVEAVEAAADGGPKTKDREEIPSTGEEVSTLPVPLPGQPDRPAEEISATPITLPKEDPDGIKAGSDEISATPITLPKEDPDGIKAGSDEVSATPITLPKEDPDGIKAGSDEVSTTQRAEDGEIVAGLDETSFKVESPSPDWDEDPPRPPQGIMEEGRSESEDGEESSIEDEKLILDADSFKPVPALSPDDVKIEDGGRVTGDGKQTPTEPITEKELPEDGQLQEGLDQREDLQGMMDKDLDSLFPGEGEIVGADGKKVGGSKLGDDVKGIPGMDSGGKIDDSSEDPSGDQFAGKGMFKPGKGPGGGETEAGGPGKNYTYTEDEANVMELITSGASKERIAAKERQLQHDAISETLLVFGGAEKGKTQKQKTDKEDPPPPPPKKSSQESTPDGKEGGSDIKIVSQEEFDAVIDKVDGGQISTQDPDGQPDVVPDSMTPEGAKRVKDAMDMAASSKGKQKKAGSEVVTDPDSEDQEDKGGGRLGKKLGL